MPSAEASEDIDILTSLGLSLGEAKVFSALSELGESTAHTISTRSGEAREFVYRILPRLVKKGLVEVTVTSPKSFKAIPLKEAYTLLLKRRKEENRRLRSRAMKALEKPKKPAFPAAAIDSQISLVPLHEPPDTRIGQEYKSVQESVDLIFPSGKFLQWSRYYADISLREILKRNVKMRVITQQSLLRIMAAHPKVFTRGLKSKLKRVDFRYVKKPFSVEMMIFDKKALFVSTTEESDINKMVWLRSNNPLLLEMANGYFEAMWKKATQCQT
jgi:hypothetical protein